MQRLVNKKLYNIVGKLQVSQLSWNRIREGRMTDEAVKLDQFSKDHVQVFSVVNEILLKDSDPGII